VLELGRPFILVTPSPDVDGVSSKDHLASNVPVAASRCSV
jgi:hypothetical protein